MYTYNQVNRQGRAGPTEVGAPLRPAPVIGTSWCAVGSTPINRWNRHTTSTQIPDKLHHNRQLRNEHIILGFELDCRRNESTTA